MLYVFSLLCALPLAIARNGRRKIRSLWFPNLDPTRLVRAALMNTTIIRSATPLDAGWYGDRGVLLDAVAQLANR